MLVSLRYLWPLIPASDMSITATERPAKQSPGHEHLAWRPILLDQCHSVHGSGVASLSGKRENQVQHLTAIDLIGNSERKFCPSVRGHTISKGQRSIPRRFFRHVEVAERKTIDCLILGRTYLSLRSKFSMRPKSQAPRRSRWGTYQTFLSFGRYFGSFTSRTP